MNTFEILLPHYDFSERHAIIIRGQASDILDAVAAFRVQNDPLVRQIIRLRELPVNAVSKFPTCAVGKFPSTDMGISH